MLRGRESQPRAKYPMDIYTFSDDWRSLMSVILVHRISLSDDPHIGHQSVSPSFRLGHQKTDDYCTDLETQPRPGLGPEVPDFPASLDMVLVFEANSSKRGVRASRPANINTSSRDP